MIAARDPLAQPRQAAFDTRMRACEIGHIAMPSISHEQFDTRMRACEIGAINPTILDKHSIFNIKKQYLFRLLNLL